MGVSLRICSLLPSATEIVFELGLSDRLVAVTHECDYPLEATRLPVITMSGQGPLTWRQPLGKNSPTAIYQYKSQPAPRHSLFISCNV